MGVKVVKTKDEFDSELSKAGDSLVVVDFFATWCGPCKMIGPKIEAFSNQFGDVVFLQVDVDENAEVAEEQGISAMPTFKFFKNGKRVDEVIGASEQKILDAITKNR